MAVLLVAKGHDPVTIARRSEIPPFISSVGRVF